MKHVQDLQNALIYEEFDTNKNSSKTLSIIIILECFFNTTIIARVL